MPDGRIDIDTKVDSKGAEAGFKDIQEQLTRASKEFKEAEKALRPFRMAIVKTEVEMLKLAKASKNYSGTNEEFMRAVKDLGAEQKRAIDEMLRNNDRLKQSYIEQAARFMNVTTHAEKLHSMYEKINPTIARLTSGSLQAAAAMQRFAASGSAAQIALETLGPTASAKDLSDFIRTLNQSLGAVPVVALAAAAAFGILTAAIAKAAAGPKPSEIYAKQAELMAKYQEELEKRAQEIYNTWSLFEKATINATNPATLMKNLREQVRILREWSDNLAILTKRGVDIGLVGELRAMGPKAAGEIAAMVKMTDKELAEYEKLWLEKLNHAYNTAELELIGLRLATEHQMKLLGDSIKPLGKALERFQETWAEALGPFVEVWGIIFAKIVDGATAIGQLIVRLNEINPAISTIIFSVLYLATAFTLLGIPLALTGKLMTGLRAIAFAYGQALAPIISLFASAGTMGLVFAGVLVALAAVFYLLWTRNEAFRDGVITAWERIASAAEASWGFIWGSILQPILSAILAFGVATIGQLRAFWEENGNDIAKATKIVFGAVWKDISTILGFILGLFKFIFPIAAAIVTSSWDVIRIITQTLITMFLNLVRVIVALINGDWKGAFQAGKDIVRNMKDGVLDLIESLAKGVVNILGRLGVQVYDALGDIAGKFSESGKKFMQSLADGIENGIGTVTGTIEDVAQKIRDYLPFSPAKIGPLKDLNKLDFGGPMVLSIEKAIPKVKASMEHLFNLAPYMQQKRTEATTQGSPNVTQNVQFNNVEDAQTFKRKLLQANRELALEFQT